MLCSCAALRVACLRNAADGGNSRFSCRTELISFCAMLFTPDSNRGGNATRLLPQYIAKSVLIEKAAQFAAVLWSALQIVQRCVKRHVADDSGQAARQIGRFFVLQQFSSDRRR